MAAFRALDTLAKVPLLALKRGATVRATHVVLG